ncbi:hypothetical protein R3P38DRAFT_3204196 [Favolaschia claudopus]|uniref:Uncharacterized protein n=1 Tax=Favolaschia claudopus TaxID=2862362 RepID=A0AAW0ARN3_9AGAR
MAPTLSTFPFVKNKIVSDLCLEKAKDLKQGQLADWAFKNEHGQLEMECFGRFWRSRVAPVDCLLMKHRLTSLYAVLQRK